MHKIKDYLKLKKLSDKEKIHLTSFQDFLKRRNILYNGTHIYITNNEYPHIEYKHNLVIRFHEHVYRIEEKKKWSNPDWQKEVNQVISLLKFLYPENTVVVRYSFGGDSVAKDHIHIFIRYGFLKELFIKTFYKIKYKLWKSLNLLKS